MQLDFDAYESWEHLVDYVEDVLRKVGTELILHKCLRLDPPKIYIEHVERILGILVSIGSAQVVLMKK